MDKALAQKLFNTLAKISEDVRYDQNDYYLPKWQRITDDDAKHFKENYSQIQPVELRINKDIHYNGYLGIINKKMHYRILESILLKLMHILLQPYNFNTVRVTGLTILINFDNNKDLSKVAILFKETTSYVSIDIDTVHDKIKLEISNKLRYDNQIQYKVIKDGE